MSCGRNSPLAASSIANPPASSSSTPSPTIVARNPASGCGWAALLAWSLRMIPSLVSSPGPRRPARSWPNPGLCGGPPAAGQLRREQLQAREQLLPAGGGVGVAEQLHADEPGGERERGVLGWEQACKRCAAGDPREAVG